MEKIILLNITGRIKMGVIGIISSKKEMLKIEKELQEYASVIRITSESIKNVKNVRFDEIIFNRNLKIKSNEYKYMTEILNQTNYILVNSDVDIPILQEIKLEKPIKIITYGFNSKTSISVSSVEEDYIIISIQRKIEKRNKKKIENQEIKIEMKYDEKIKIYEKIIIFIIKELHNL